MEEIKNPPEVKIGLTKNIFVRELHFKSAGDEEPACKFKFDYLAILVKGRLKTLRNNTVYFDHSAPHMIFFQGGLEQKLIALEDDTLVYNIHVLREVDPNNTDKIINADDVPMDSNIKKILEHLIEK
jgi:hypothetical protein